MYPPENVQILNSNRERHLKRIRKEVSAKYHIDEDTLASIVSEYGARIAALNLSPEFIGTKPTGSGFKAVDTEHFRKLENLRTFHFVRDCFVDGAACDGVEHELGLMVLEIKELRAVLLRQFKYHWTEHRKNFPLITQSNP